MSGLFHPQGPSQALAPSHQQSLHQHLQLQQQGSHNLSMQALQPVTLQLSSSSAASAHPVLPDTSSISPPPNNGAGANQLGGPGGGAGNHPHGIIQQQQAQQQAHQQQQQQRTMSWSTGGFTKVEVAQPAPSSGSIKGVLSNSLISPVLLAFFYFVTILFLFLFPHFRILLDCVFLSLLYLLLFLVDLFIHFYCYFRYFFEFPPEINSPSTVCLL